ncbi:MgtC/SapB family protein [Vallitalea okinawensis]|uniref:MgtC/SapB family protein n=1 Tax=Vallitalea okinawensis TaxID=2078660 RepID=UPI000CFDFE50|nr:MgtC/SapB family protein [Vallitalea okinawensis]
MAAGYSLTLVDAITRLLLAFILGGIIGWERENTNRPAGFRTHILVATSGCLAMIVNYEMFETFGGLTNMDPGRMGSYVISGIGFLGAGTIIREGASVKGLTTAASLWASAMLGLACGAGLYEISILVTLLIIFTLLVMNKVEHRVSKKRQKKDKKHKKTKKKTQTVKEELDGNVFNQIPYDEILKHLLEDDNVEITIKKKNDDDIDVYTIKKQA